MSVRIKKIKTIQYILVKDDDQETPVMELKNNIKEEKTFGNYESVDDFKVNFKRSKRFKKILNNIFYRYIKYVYDTDYIGDKVPHGSKYEGLNNFPRYILVSNERDEFYDETYIYGAKDSQAIKDLMPKIKGSFEGVYDLNEKKPKLRMLHFKEQI